MINRTMTSDTRSGYYKATSITKLLPAIMHMHYCPAVYGMDNKAALPLRIQYVYLIIGIEILNFAR